MPEEIFRRRRKTAGGYSITAENAERAEMKNELNRITETIIGAAMAVHRELGP
jgi:hypothetical protein